jgi:hypothetical protein
LQDAAEQNPFVTPAQAGVQKSQECLDSRLRGNDSKDGENRFLSYLPMWSITAKLSYRAEGEMFLGFRTPTIFSRSANWIERTFWPLGF